MRARPAASASRATSMTPTEATAMTPRSAPSSASPRRSLSYSSVPSASGTPVRGCGLAGAARREQVVVEPGAPQRDLEARRPQGRRERGAHRAGTEDGDAAGIAHGATAAEPSPSPRISASRSSGPCNAGNSGR